MTAPEPSTRQRIIEMADRLFYQRGFEHTAFADIAGALQMSRGNFYYHFKTKDEILAAVIAHRAAQTQAMLEGWARQGATPAARLQCFAQMLIDNRHDIQRHGCPVGTLCAELAKLAHPSQGDAGMVFGQFRQWLAAQFQALGRAGDADALAMHLLARSQGIAALANAFHDETFIRREVAQIGAWVNSLASPGARRGKPGSGGRAARTG
ncbi:TetR/AcrR family transcriptional regulator [Acidovorax sp.]|uniref:TetR/AcrR family transcriptional regulator n=1 Tax=Acidovorax sp. TaxID=1872122 RepID=UPI002ACE9B97|nr:TetR/AcrR family transcriptional regulator [Acidovorax sp.]MDZ7864276.1 TetR/AcrR family transcriptional regulator [Acidovorax sp.]